MSYIINSLKKIWLSLDSLRVFGCSTRPRLPLNLKNIVSVEENKLDTLNKLQKEVELGRMLGLFNRKPISTLRISPIGLVEKGDHSW